MTAYRLTAEEFIFLAYQTGLTHLPKWCGYDTEQLDVDKISSSIVKKEFLISSDQGNVMPHPVIAYIFYLMKNAAVWCCFGESAFLYMSEKRYILLEQSSAQTGRVRLIPMENASSCFAYLDECSYVKDCQILYDDTVSDAAAEAADLKDRMEAYFEQ